MLWWTVGRGLGSVTWRAFYFQTGEINILPWRVRGVFFSTEHRAVPSEFQAPRYRAEPAIGPDEPQADPNLPAVQSHQRETRPGPGQQEGERQRRRRSGTRLDTSDR